jgi:hypothetical protein
MCNDDAVESCWLKPSKLNPRISVTEPTTPLFYSGGFRYAIDCKEWVELLAKIIRERAS